MGNFLRCSIHLHPSPSQLVVGFAGYGLHLLPSLALWFYPMRDNPRDEQWKKGKFDFFSSAPSFIVVYFSSMEKSFFVRWSFFQSYNSTQVSSFGNILPPCAFLSTLV